MKKRYLAAFLLLSTWATMAAGQTAFNPSDVAVKADQVYGHKYGLAMTFDVFSPRGANGAAVLFINSGGYVSGRMRQCEPTAEAGWVFIPIEPLDRWGGLPRLIVEQYSFEKLLAAGFTVFDVRLGSSPKFTIDEMSEDCSRAVRHVKFHAGNYGIDPERIGLWGGSAGGHLALLTAAHVVQGNASPRKVDGAFELNRFSEPELEVGSGVRAVAVYYPAGYDLVSDLRDFPQVMAELPALSVGEEALAASSVKGYLGPAHPPVLLIYGDQDFPFILGASRNIAADLERHNVEVKTVVLPGVAHEFKGPNGYQDARPGQAAMEELVSWFRSTLRNSSTSPQTRSPR